MKNVERALIATGVALVFSGGIASAAILWTSATAAAAQPGIGTQLAAQLGTNPVSLADNGLRGGADLITAAATYIGITPADLKTTFKIPSESTADVTIRRAQAFKANPNETIRWTFGDASGDVKPDAEGCVTVPKVKLTATPAMLRLKKGN